MLEIDRSARTEVSAPPERCLELLAAVERYPSWSDLIEDVEVLERSPEGVARSVRLRARVLGLPVVMDCAIEVAAGRAVLRRLPYGSDDDERFEAGWEVRTSGSGSAVALHVTAALDAPGPAGLLRGRVERRLADGLVHDFEQALSER